KLASAISKYIRRLPPAPASTAARAEHLLGVVSVRLNRFSDAEAALTRALQRIEPDAPARAWILDTISQVFMGEGAWTEARRTFAAVASIKTAARDWLGLAISRGSLVLLELRLGHF